MARLQLTHVTFLDSIYDPFGSVTDVLDFLNLQKFQNLWDEDETDAFIGYIKFELSNSILI